MTNARGFPQLRIVHLSDLHFGKKHICNPPDPSGSAKGIPTLEQRLLDDLTADDWAGPALAQSSMGELEIPLVLAITGDLTQTADQKEFDKAADLIESLLSKPVLGTRIGLKDVFIIPGNHDVIYSNQLPEHRFPFYCNMYNRVFESLQPNSRIFARPGRAIDLNQVHAFPESRFMIAEINSCFYVEKETEDESRGQVDHEAIALLRRLLDKHRKDSKQWIKVALVHHHPVLMPFFCRAWKALRCDFFKRELTSAASSRAWLPGASSRP